ncbi:MAG: TIGR02147 family protein [Fibrobacterales bacterium]
MPIVFDYLNYRLYLKDLFKEEKKKPTSQITHKYILAELGITSTGFMSNVIAARKNLTHIQATKIGKILKFKKHEMQYFEILVYFTQSKTIEEKNEYFNRLVTLQKVKMKVIDKKRMSLFSKWYYVFVRELLESYNYKGETTEDHTKLAKKMIPPIKTSEAQEAINYLSDMALIDKDDEGYYRPVNSAISTGDEVKSLHTAKFQLDTMDMGKNALNKVNPKERDISCLSMSLSEDTFNLIKMEIQYFRKRLAKLAVEETNLQRVYQLNFQFFPVTTETKDGK